MTRTSTPRSVRNGDARARAADVLVRVETDGAFAAPALDAALGRDPALSPADRGLLTELVYGVLRTQRALDARLERHATRANSLAALDPYTRAVLRLAAYQILALGRVPPRAAVHAAVEAVKRGRSEGLARFVNALLRRLADERPADALPDDARAQLALAATPEAVISRLADALGGRDEALAVLRAGYARTPAIGLRVNPLRTTRDALAERLREELADGAAVAPGTVSPLALRLTAGGTPARTAAHAAGLFAVQEEGAQCVALASGARPGMAVLDACAGRGGKTGALGAMLESRGVLHATDVYPEKITRIAPELERLGILGPGLAFAAAAADLTRGLGALAAAVPARGYDVVVVDAPCSGLGTLARRPDIIARPDAVVAATSDDADAPLPSGGSAAAPSRVSLPELQRAILSRVAPLVAPGGVLLYAVCTLTRDEGEAQVAAFRAAHPAFVPVEGDAAAMPARLRPAAVILRPDIDGTDGFMLFRLRRENIA